jgi:hypothetical protein
MPWPNAQSQPSLGAKSDVAGWHGSAVVKRRVPMFDHCTCSRCNKEYSSQYASREQYSLLQEAQKA